MGKRISTVVVLLTLMTQPSLSQEWSGYYLGVHAGSVETNIRQGALAIPGNPPPTVGNSTGNFAYKGHEKNIGFFFGRNYQTGKRVNGWEINVSRGGEANYVTPVPSGQFYISNNKASVDLAYRHGILWGPDTLFYVRGGPSYLHNELEWKFAIGELINQDLLGLTIGGGVERRMRVGNLRAELLYSTYLADDFTSGNFPNVIYSDRNERVQIRIGYSIPFGRATH